MVQLVLLNWTAFNMAKSLSNQVCASLKHSEML